jgi:hypothetical protein
MKRMENSSNDKTMKSKKASFISQANMYFNEIIMATIISVQHYVKAFTTQPKRDFSSEREFSSQRYLTISTELKRYSTLFPINQSSLKLIKIHRQTDRLCNITREKSKGFPQFPNSYTKITGP